MCRDPVRHLRDSTAAPVPVAEDHALRCGPGLREQPRVCATKGLGRGIGVTREHQGNGTITGEHPEQAAARRRELLGVVDHDEPHPRPQAVQRLRITLQVLGRRSEDPRGVEGTGVGERGDLVVFAQHGRAGHPLLTTVGRAQRSEVLGVEPELDGAHEQVAQLGTETSGRQRALQ